MGFEIDKIISGDIFLNGANVFADTLKKLCETYKSGQEDWHLFWEESKQCRTHKKRRINKKWAKRYGMKYVLHDIPVRVDEVDFVKMKLDVIPNSALLVDMNKIKDYFYEPILPYNLIEMENINSRE